MPMEVQRSIVTAIPLIDCIGPPAHHPAAQHLSQYVSLAALVAFGCIGFVGVRYFMGVVGVIACSGAIGCIGCIGCPGIYVSKHIQCTKLN